MTTLFTNNAVTVLASGITNVATSLTVTTGQGALFPSPITPDYFWCTLQNVSGTQLEIVKVTARSGDVFTIVRGQEGTAAAAFNANDKVELRLTNQGIQDIKSDTVATTKAAIGSPIKILGTATNGTMAQNNTIEISHTAYSEANTALKRDVMVMEEGVGSTTTNTSSFEPQTATYVLEYTLPVTAGSITPNATTTTTGDTVATSNSTTGTIQLGTTGATTTQTCYNQMVYCTGGTATGFTIYFGANVGTPTSTIRYYFGRVTTPSGAIETLDSNLFQTGTFTPTASSSNTINFGSNLDIKPGFYQLILYPTAAEAAINRYYTIATGATAVKGSACHYWVNSMSSATLSGPYPTGQIGINAVTAISNSVNLKINGANYTKIELTHSANFDMTDLGKEIVATTTSGAQIVGFKNIAVGGTATEVGALTLGGTGTTNISDIFEDGTISTFLSGTTSSTDYIQYDFGSAKTVRGFSYVKLQVNTGPYTYDTDNSKPFILQYSTDGTNYFTQAYTKLTNPSLFDGVAYCKVTSPVSARYIRLYMPTTSATPEIRKLQFYDCVTALVTGSFTNTNPITTGNWHWKEIAGTNDLLRYNGNGNNTIVFNSVDESTLESISGVAANLTGTPSINVPTAKYSISQLSLANTYGLHYDSFSDYWFTYNQANNTITAFKINADGTLTYLLTDAAWPTAPSNEPTKQYNMSFHYNSSTNRIYCLTRTGTFTYSCKTVSGNTLTNSFAAVSAFSNTSPGFKSYFCNTYSCVVSFGGNASSTSQHFVLMRGGSANITDTSPTLFSGTTIYNSIIGQIDDTHYLCAVVGSNGTLYAQVFTVTSDTTASTGTLLTCTGTYNGGNTNLAIVRLSSTKFGILINRDGTTSNPQMCFVPLTVSGTTLTQGTTFQLYQPSQLFYGGYSAIPDGSGSFFLRMGTNVSKISESGGVYSSSKSTPLNIMPNADAFGQVSTTSSNTSTGFVTCFGQSSVNFYPAFDLINSTLTLFPTTTPTLYYQLTFSFDGGSTYKIYKSGTWRAVASNLNSVHGGTNGIWYYLNNSSVWTVATNNTSNNAISLAVAMTNNQVPHSDYATYNLAILTSATSFVKSTTATFGMSFTWLYNGSTMMWPNSPIDCPNTYLSNNAVASTEWLQMNYLQYTQTGRSTWTANYGYTTNFGYPNKVQITKTSAGTASVKAIAFGEYTP